MMRATEALLGLGLALAASGLARAQALDSRTALFDAAFAPHATPARPFATASVGAHPVIVSPPGLTPISRPIGAVAFDQPGYLTAADEGALDFAGPEKSSTLSLTTKGGYEFAFVPQGGFDAAGGASAAQAGAMVRVGADIQGKVMDGLNKMGMHTVDSAALANRGRLYLFAAYSGKEVGLNIGHGTQGGIQRLGWSAEGASTLVSDGQVGVGWRKGKVQASVGYVHRDVNSNYDNGFGNVGMQKLSDNMVAFTLSLHAR